MVDQRKYIHFLEMYGKGYPDLQKEKQYRIEQELWLRQEQCRKIRNDKKNAIIELKATKFHKSSIAKLFRSRKISKSLQSRSVTDPEIT